MKSRKVSWVASAALSALFVAAVFLLSGCGKETPVPKPEQARTDAPEVYMKDPVFIKHLDVQKKERNRLLARRCKLDEALAAEKARDPASPKIKELQAQRDAAVAAFESNRLATAAIVRERLTRKKGNTK